MSLSYKGISFPFRLNSNGGVTMSEANITSIPHIVESMQQVLSTSKMERCMEYHIYSELDLFVFQPNDSSARTLLEYNIKKALELEKHIQVESVDVYSKDNVLYANIYFSVPEFGGESYSSNFKLGG